MHSQASIFAIRPDSASSYHETMQATAQAQPNIALVKYWGKRDLERNIPAVDSLSMRRWQPGFRPRPEARL